MKLNELSHEVIGAAIEIHRKLGPGLLESAYRRCLGHELFLRGIPFEKEYPLPLEYKESDLRPDTDRTSWLTTASLCK